MKNPPGQGRDGGMIRFILWLVATEMIHMIEEVVAGFLEDFPLLFNVTVTCEMFAASFLIASAVGVLAALGLIYWNPIANYFVWLFAIGPGIVNGIVHFVFPVLAGTFLFPRFNHRSDAVHRRNPVAQKICLGAWIGDIDLPPIVVPLPMDMPPFRLWA